MHFSLHGHFGGFHILVLKIMLHGHGSKNIPLRPSFQLLWIYTQKRDYMVPIVLLCWGTSMMFSIMIYFLQTVNRISISTVFIFLTVFTIRDKRWYHWLICISLMISNVEIRYYVFPLLSFFYQFILIFTKVFMVYIFALFCTLIFRIKISLLWLLLFMSVERDPLYAISCFIY